jgi:hypothetical protein
MPIDADTNNDILQESLAFKKAWLEEAQKAFPIGHRVEVVNSDIEEYIGVTGSVAGYDLGFSGDYPLIRINFDNPVYVSGPTDCKVDHDGFYQEELEYISTPVVSTQLNFWEN